MTEIKNTQVIESSDISDEQLNSMIDETLINFEDGDLIDGTIVKIEHDEVLVDIGFKSEGYIPVRELSIRKDADPADLVNLGDEIEALVLQKEDKDGRLLLSKKRAEYERSWAETEEKFKNGETVSGQVIEVVKGGLIVDIGLRGFLPASLVELRRVKELDMYIDTEIEARVIEMDRNRNNVVLSRRVLLEEGRKNERAEIISKLTKGMRLRGTVSSIVDFGAFVDLGGIDGLVHISELSWSHVSHPSEVVKVGDEVDVEILDVDSRRERISLGIKQTTEDPWLKQVSEFPVGSIVDGEVLKLVPFGVFVDLGNGVEGLVHISEMAARHIDSPAQVVKVGTKVKVKVMEINPERRRVSLSMKAAADELGFEIPVSEPEPSEEKPTKRGKKSDEEKTDQEDAATDAENAESEPEEASDAEDVEESEEKDVEESEEKESDGVSEESKAEEAETPASDEDQEADEPAEDEKEEPATDEAEDTDTAEEPAADETKAETAEEPADAETAEEPATDKAEDTDTAEEPETDEKPADAESEAAEESEPE